MTTTGKQLKSKTSAQHDVQITIMQHLSYFMKYNKNLLHLDLTSTGLNEAMLWYLGTALRRAKSLISLHLSGNPGITSTLKEYLYKRVRCKAIEEVNQIKFNQAPTHISTKKSEPLAQNIQEGVQLRNVLNQKRLNNSTIGQSNPMDESTLIFQRWLGHKEEMPGSGQWRMLTALGDNCWVCDKWTYSLIFWSQTVGNVSSDNKSIIELESLRQ